eukprot:5941000-Prymnesium_polylepis.1
MTWPRMVHTALRAAADSPRAAPARRPPPQPSAPVTRRSVHPLPDAAVPTLRRAHAALRGLYAHLVHAVRRRVVLGVRADGQGRAPRAPVHAQARPKME